MARGSWPSPPTQSRSIEDCAHSHGARIRTVRLPAAFFGHAASFSFLPYPGESRRLLRRSCMATNDPAIAEPRQAFAQHGQRENTTI